MFSEGVEKTVFEDNAKDRERKRRGGSAVRMTSAAKRWYIDAILYYPAVWKG